MSEQKIEIPISFVNKIQEDFYYCNKRNECFSGGFGNGKSFGGSMKAITLLCTFPKYRVAISRYLSKDLVTSTMSTFFKLCPPQLYAEAYGGRRNDRDGYLRLINGSEIFWIHLDDYSETSLRGLEINSHLGDQMEEIAEGIYNIIDVRIERWDVAEIPSYMNKELFPKNPYTHKPMPPCYNMVLCNPDTTVHWIYRIYHPDSAESHNYLDTHAFFTASMHDNPAIAESLKLAHRSREPAWVDRFYWGKWGISGGGIHRVSSASILELIDKDPAVALRQQRSKNSTLLTKTDLDKLLGIINRDGIRYRVMDHGEAAPTVCLWFAYLPADILYKNYGIKSKGIHICYREYYQPDRLISYHREAIAALSKDEKYYGNYADPAIFKKTSQKDGGRWSVADEYIDKRITGAPILWLPADNNEMATRNAVSEMLIDDPLVIHPITGASPAPLMYFLKKGFDYPSGANNVIHQTQSARHKKIGSVNGEDIYSDDRDPNVTDHAYDPLRYYSIMPKTNEFPKQPKDVPQFSFNNFINKRRLDRHRRGGVYGR